MYEVLDGQQAAPEVPLEGLTELQQQRLLVADLLSVFAGGTAEYAQLTVVEGADAAGSDGGRHIIYRLSEHCDCCSAFVQDTAAKCDVCVFALAPLHGNLRRHNSQFEIHTPPHRAMRA